MKGRDWRDECKRHHWLGEGGACPKCADDLADRLEAAERDTADFRRGYFMVLERAEKAESALADTKKALEDAFNEFNRLRVILPGPELRPDLTEATPSQAYNIADAAATRIVAALAASSGEPGTQEPSG